MTKIGRIFVSGRVCRERDTTFGQLGPARGQCPGEYFVFLYILVFILLDVL
jgi:hypothetical protein